MGVAPLVAHLSCDHWGGVSAFTAMRLGMAAYIVPFVFAYWPSLVLRHEADPLTPADGHCGRHCRRGRAGRAVSERALAWWKLGLFAASIVLAMHPAALANVAAVAIVLGIGLSAYRAARTPLHSGETPS